MWVLQQVLIGLSAEKSNKFFIKIKQNDIFI